MTKKHNNEIKSSKTSPPQIQPMRYEALTLA